MTEEKVKEIADTTVAEQNEEPSKQEEKVDNKKYEEEMVLL